MSRRQLLASFAVAIFVCAAATTAAVTSVPMTAPSQDMQVYKPGNGVTLPSPIHEVKADYTPEAMQKKIEGNVIMALVVLDTGDVGDVQIRRSLDAEYGLDRQAVLAAKQWKFRPGTKDGTPVAVEIFMQMTFALK